MHARLQLAYREMRGARGFRSYDRNGGARTLQSNCHRCTLNGGRLRYRAHVRLFYKNRMPFPGPQHIDFRLIFRGEPLSYQLTSLDRSWRV